MVPKGPVGRVDEWISHDLALVLVNDRARVTGSHLLPRYAVGIQDVQAFPGERDVLPGRPGPEPADGVGVGVVGVRRSWGSGRSRPRCTGAPDWPH